MPVVLATRLGIENEDLVEVEGRLGQVIKLDRGRQGDVRIVDPDVHRVEHRGREASVHILDAQVWNT